MNSAFPQLAAMSECKVIDEPFRSVAGWKPDTVTDLRRVRNGPENSDWDYPAQRIASVSTLGFKMICCLNILAQNLQSNSKRKTLYPNMKSNSQPNIERQFLINTTFRSMGVDKNDSRKPRECCDFPASS
jgi:hypothetical protein